MSTPIRWGILGPGSIAGKFAEGLEALPDAQLAAIGSRTPERAAAFAARFAVPRVHSSYEELVQDAEIDAIYVATPHPFHKEHTILCLEAGKAVLCEKPFTINATEAEAVVQLARTRNIFLMEAMWTRFLPAMAKVRQWIATGAIGAVRMIQADFGFRAGLNPQGRLFNLELGGGALLDIGVYTVSFASMLLGAKPTQIKALAHIGETGVDEQAGIVMGYEDGALAVLSTAVRTTTAHEARILGTEGMICIEPSFWKSEKITLRAGDREEIEVLPLIGNGYNYEAAEVGACLRQGQVESEVMPLDETIEIMHILDTIRAQWGLQYPSE